MNMNECRRCCCTYDPQLGAVGDLAGGILAMAAVVAGMLGRHTLDGQDAAASAQLCDEYVLIIVIEERLLVKCPAYVQGQIALGQGALIGYILAQMRGLGARGKGRYLGWYFRVA